MRQQQLREATLAAALTPEQCAELSPLEVMRAIMRNRFRAGDYDGALAAARECAPYVHAKLTSTDLKVSGTLTTRSDEELSLEIAAIEQKLAAARTLN
jgi:hypothetical protein